MSDQERRAAEKISPEFFALANASTRSELVRRFCDFSDASLTNLFMGHGQLDAGNAPDGLTERLYDLSTATFTASMRQPRLTAMGLRLPYMDTALRTVEIEADNLTEDRDLNATLARNYWKGIGSIIFTQEPSAAPVITGRDVFIPLQEFSETSSAFETALQGDIAEWKGVRAEFMEECQTLRQWTIPWGAYVEINYLGFVGVELYEVRGAVGLKWRRPDQLCAYTTMNPNLGFIIHSHNAAERVRTHWSMFAAALVRDFWVAEERRKLFAVTVKRIKRGQRRRGEPERRVVYLPRIRYDQPVRPAIATLAEREEGRARHFVRPFFRKTKPTATQIEIARLNDVTVPDNHTWVRGHFRGGSDVAVVFRSRSAMQLLYRTASIDIVERELETDWFRFEEMVRALLEMQGFQAERIAAQGRTDGGIDIIALQKSNAMTWLVQAKCYAQDRPVGPDIIREMLGSLQEYSKRYPDQRPGGMVVTTSKFTGEAQRIALAHGVRLIDGANLRAIAEAENKRAMGRA
jgi:hypothetical protein